MIQRECGTGEALIAQQHWPGSAVGASGMPVLFKHSAVVIRLIFVLGGVFAQLIEMIKKNRLSVWGDAHRWF